MTTEHTINHTPGPWAVVPGFDGFELDIEAHGYCIAAIPDVPGATEANARLIAAAPELLATLKKANLALVPSFGSAEFQAEVRRVIAKAEGREP